MSFDDLRVEALKKAELANGFSGRPTSFSLSPISKALGLFPPRPERREDVDPTKKFGQIAIAGRVVLRRDAGKKLMFLTVQDRSGQIQVALNAASLNIEQLRNTISVWDIMVFRGEMSFSNAGEPTIWADAVEFMGKTLRSSPDKVVGVVEKETRYRKRYLDLICDPDAMKRFVRRSEIVANIRKIMIQHEGYLEVDTPILETVSNGATARPFETHLNALSIDMRLRIATEISLKKLIVGGMERVFEIGRIFRNEGIDRSHNPEFTSIEMYRAYGSLDDMSMLAQKILVSCGVPTGSKDPQWQKEEFMDLIRTHAGVDPWNREETRNALRGKRKIEERMPVDLSKESDDAVLDGLFSEFVEPKLQAPTFVYHQPIGQSPLCKAWEKDPRLADRFEVYVNGMEVANAYQELNDPVEQRRRLEAQGIVDEDFIEALEHGMPACAGMGIGIDRLVMILTGAESIRDVILFPLMRPLTEKS